MQWLRTLEHVLWDFVELTMAFTLGTGLVILKWLNPSLSKWVEGVGLSQLTKIERRGMLLQISEVGLEEKELVVPSAVDEIL